MDWTRLAVDGRVTALHGGRCAGVTGEGDAFVARLRLPHPAPTTYDGLVVDSFGVLGVAPGEQTWLTGRGADGRLHLWSAYDDGSMFVPHSLEAVDAMWAAPALPSQGEVVLTCHLADGAWLLRVHAREAAILGGRPQARDLPLGADPDAALVVGFRETQPLVVAGLLGDTGSPTAWSLGAGDEDWRRIHLAPTPSALTSVGLSWDGRHTWVGGVAEGRTVAWEVLALPFRGLLRTAPVAIPRLEVDPGATGRALVLVDGGGGPLPAYVVATARGNRLCWHDGTEWKAHPAPDGALRAACAAGGAVHLLVGSQVWSVEDPTAS
jgi:hypothetical protein